MERYVIAGDDGAVLVVLMSLDGAKAQANSLHLAKSVAQRVIDVGGKVVYHTGSVTS